MKLPSLTIKLRLISLGGCLILPALHPHPVEGWGITAFSDKINQ